MNIKKTLLVAALAAAGTVGAATAARAADDANTDQNINQQQPGMAPSGADQMNQGMKDTNEGMKDQGMDQNSMRQATITVMKVDKASHTVTFKAHVQPEANVTKDGQPIKLDQLKEGDQVRASFDPSTGDVKSLEVSRKVK